MATDDDKTMLLDPTKPRRSPCPDCFGTGQLRLDSENINENFEVEKRTVLTPCGRCEGTGGVSTG